MEDAPVAYVEERYHVSISININSMQGYNTASNTSLKIIILQTSQKFYKFLGGIYLSLLVYYLKYEGQLLTFPVRLQF